MRVILLVNRGLMASSLNIHGGVWAQTPFLDSLAAESLVARKHFSEVANPGAVRGIWAQGLSHWPEGSVVRLFLGNQVSTCPDWPGLPQPKRLQPGLWKRPLQKEIEAARETPAKLIILETDFLLPPWEEELLTIGDPGPALDGSEEEDLDIEDEAAEGDEEEESQSSEEESNQEGVDSTDDEDSNKDEDSEEDEESDDEDRAELPPPPPQEPFALKEGPLDPDGPDFRRMQAARGVLLAAWDEELEAIYKLADEEWSGQSWALVITSDLGYPLGEADHVGPDPKRLLNQEHLWVPLVIHAPGVEPGSTVRDFTSHRTLSQWLAQAAAWTTLQPPIPPLEGAPMHLALCPEKTIAAIRSREATLIAPLEKEDPAPEEVRWYEQPEDCLECNDLASREVDRVAIALKQLAAIMKERNHP